MREIKAQLAISCHQMKLPASRLGSIQKSCEPMGFHGNPPKNPQDVAKIIGCSLQTDGMNPLLKTTLVQLCMAKDAIKRTKHLPTYMESFFSIMGTLWRHRSWSSHRAFTQLQNLKEFSAWKRQKECAHAWEEERERKVQTRCIVWEKYIFLIRWGNT